MGQKILAFVFKLFEQVAWNFKVFDIFFPGIKAAHQVVTATKTLKLTGSAGIAPSWLFIKNKSLSAQFCI